MAESANLGLPYMEAAQAQKHVTHNEALDILDAVVHLSVHDRDLVAPPSTPQEGDRYLVAAGATGTWAGQEGRIAAFQAGGWMFYPPRSGWIVWIIDETAALIFDGISWVPFGGSDTSTLQNVQLFGLRATADEMNPLSVTLNNALFNALYEQYGGNGDLRYLLNKEAQANTVSFLLQQGFSGRAELGLVADDDFVLKTSPDGSAWAEALRASGNGHVSLPANPKFSAFTDFDNALTLDTWTKIAINNTEYDNRAVFDSMSNHFVAPMDGLYLFGASALFKLNASANARMRARLVKNGSDVIPGSLGGITGPHTTTVTALWLQVATVLAQGDTVELQGYFAGDTGIFAANHTRFWGALLA
ncbi:DUF2793 domain-containing protein [Rhodoligotrophos ferricapiens]|uniref:DUF2793 domain-containing protein n=1 Tax=Rhodoligotrophos ferricapiens TaxID=3069264 RepID=UPI00315D18DC